MAEQWKAIDAMIEKAYQEHQQKIKNPPQIDCKNLTEGEAKYLINSAGGVQPDEYTYIYIRDYLKKHHVLIDDALRNRIYSYVAKKDPLTSRFDYYKGIKSLQEIREYVIPAEAKEVDPDGLIDKTIPIRDQIMKHRLLQYEQKNKIGSGESFTATLATSLTNPQALIGNFGTLAKVVFCGAELGNQWLSSKDRPTEETQKNQNKVDVKYIPEWMFRQMKFDYFSTASLQQLKVAQKWAEDNAKIYERRLNLMYSQNKHYIRVGNKTLSDVEVKQRIAEYRLFATNAKSAQTIPESFKKGFPVPIDKLKTVSDEQLAKAAKFCQEKCDAYINKYNAAVKNGTLTFKEGGKEYSFYEYDVRSRQYLIYAEKIQKEAERRIAVAQTAQTKAQQQQQQQRAAQSNASVQVASSVNPSVTPGQPQTPQNAMAYSQTAAQPQTAQMQAQSPLNGWDGLMSNQFGMSNFGEMKGNMGYILAMLPDMLVGMFTGKSRNLKFKDNIFPIAAIMMGLFMKHNPLLKMLLIGFGGMQLFKKASAEILEDAGVKTNEPKQYKQYDDERLDPRIRNVAMKGNTMLADIDGKPMVLTISQTAVDAYYKGKLPLNTLANAVLQKYDAQQAELSLAFERSIDNNQDQQRNIGIK